LHEITALLGRRYSLLIQLIDMNGTASFTMYDYIRVLDEMRNYTLELGTTFGTYRGACARTNTRGHTDAYTVDQLLPSRGVSFGTFDKDTDRVAGATCARIWQAGWWYEPRYCNAPNGTHTSAHKHMRVRTGNLNMPYDVDLSDSRLQGIQWPTDTGSVRVRSVQMKIRPVDFVSPFAPAAAGS
jgi:hypothetical protein